MTWLHDWFLPFYWRLDSIASVVVTLLAAVLMLQQWDSNCKSSQRAKATCNRLHAGQDRAAINAAMTGAQLLSPARIAREPEHFSLSFSLRWNRVDQSQITQSVHQALMGDNAAHSQRYP